MIVLLLCFHAKLTEMARVCGTVVNSSDTDPQEYMSARHLDWRAREMDFVLAQARRGVALPEPRPDGAHPDAIDEVAYLNKLRDPTTRDAAVVALVQAMGPRALWPHPLCGDLPRNEGEARRRAEVRRLLRERVEACYQDARLARNIRERRAAADLLRAMGTALAGDQRGLRDRAILNPFEVRGVYFHYVFRATRALELLAVWPYSRSPAERVRAVAEACGFPQDELRWLLLTSDGDRRLSVRARGGALMVPWLEEHARTATALKFGITEQRVANILTPSGVADAAPRPTRRRRARA
jgi:hypothetical protein